MDWMLGKSHFKLCDSGKDAFFSPALRKLCLKLL